MRISDWSSDVCSSDLRSHGQERPPGHRWRHGRRRLANPGIAARAPACQHRGGANAVAPPQETASGEPCLAAETADALTARYGPAYRWLVTGAVLMAMISMVLSSTSVAVAIPNVMGAFGVGQDKAQWVEIG